jgi:hypothetical protein
MLKYEELPPNYEVIRELKQNEKAQPAGRPSASFSLPGTTADRHLQPLARALPMVVRNE